MEHEVTALKVQKRNRERVNVYLDGEFAFGLARIVAAWLQIGQVLSDEKIVELQSADSREVAFQKAMKFIDYRPRSTQEVRKNLEGHGFSEELIDGVLTRLQETGMINDQRFAQGWVENRSTFRPRSKRALAYELRQRGVEDTAIEQAVENIDDEQMACEAAIRQSRRYQGLEWPDFRQKLSGFLARRGFHYEAISTAVAYAWEQQNAGAAAEDEIET